MQFRQSRHPAEFRMNPSHHEAHRAAAVKPISRSLLDIGRAVRIDDQGKGITRSVVVVVDNSCYGLSSIHISLAWRNARDPQTILACAAASSAAVTPAQRPYACAESSQSAVLSPGVAK